MDDIIIGTAFADKKGEIMIVKLKGYIDQTNSFGLQKTFNDILNSGCYKIIVDFAKVLYISSAGWGIFVGEIKRFRDEDGDIKLANMTPDIYEVYQMLEFYHIFEDYNSVEDAQYSYEEFELAQGNQIVNNHVEEDSFEIDLNEESPKEHQNDNILEISIGDSTDELNNIQEELVEDNGKVSEEIDLALEQNFDSKIEANDNDLIQTEENSQFKDFNNNSDPIIDLSQLPLYEKIKKLAAEYPLLGIWQIKKLLKDKRFGSEKINILKLYKTLKELDLETKLKRYRYYRSC